MEIKEMINKNLDSEDISIWKKRPLKEVSLMNGRIGWQGLKKVEFTMNPHEPFLITGMNFKDGAIRWEEVYRISMKRYEEAKQIQLAKGDVLMTKDGTIGKLLYVDDIPFPSLASLNSHLLLFRPIRNSYVPKFLYYQLASKRFEDFIELNKSGTTFFGISQESVGKYLVLLPPLKEQKAIATALSDIDHLLQSLDQLIAKKRAIKQGAMQQLLTPPAEGGKRLEGFSGAWEVKNLGDVVEFKNGKAHENSISKHGQFIVINSKFVSTEGKVKKYSNNCLCPVYTNDIVMVMSDIPNGKAIAKCFYIGEGKHYTLNQRICALTSKSSSSKFLFYLINRHPYYLGFDDGVKQTNLRRDDVLDCPLSMPSTLQEQKAIAQVLTDMDTEIEILEQQRAKYQSIKQGMMQELLTGKTRLV